MSNRRTRASRLAPRAFSRFYRPANAIPQPELLLVDSLQVSSHASMQHAQRAVDSLLV